MTKWIAASVFALALAFATAPAGATGPEQVEQLEPEGGEWQAELSLLASHGAAAEPSFQLLRGLNDAVAVGVEIEGDGAAIESFSPTILYRIGDRATRVSVGMVGQVELATDLELVGAEARLILERQAQRWWAQGNLIVNAERETGQFTSTLAYSWRISRALGQAMWLGGEGSGQVARLGGSARAERGHYAGPALTIVHDLHSGGEIELNASFLRRVAGEGPRGTLVLSAQIGL